MLYSKFIIKNYEVVTTPLLRQSNRFTVDFNDTDLSLS